MEDDVWMEQGCVQHSASSFSSLEPEFWKKVPNIKTVDGDAKAISSNFDPKF
jgi:hypothetical protein